MSKFKIGDKVTRVCPGGGAEDVLVGHDYVVEEISCDEYVRVSGSKCFLHEHRFTLSAKEEALTAENEIDWQIGQEVYCILHGKGVVQYVLTDYDSYPVKVDCEGEIYSYTKDGKCHKDHKSRTLFFSEPEIIAEKFPPKKPFVPSFTKGETVVAKKKDGQWHVLLYVDKETETSVESASSSYLKSEYNFYKLGDEIKFS